MQKVMSKVHLFALATVYMTFSVVLEAKRLKTGARMLRLLLAYPCRLTCLYIAETETEWGSGEMWAVPSLSKKSSRALLGYSKQMVLNTADTPQPFPFSFQMEQWGGGGGEGGGRGGVRKRTYGFSNTASLLNKHKGTVGVPRIHPFKEVQTRALREL